MRRRRLRTALTTLALAAATLVTVPAAAPPAAGSPTGPSPDRDWSVAMVESTMARFTPSSIGGWSYPVGLYLYGQYLAYERTHDTRYLTYIKDYVDRFVKSDGSMSQSFNSLDSMQAGRLLVILHHETGQDRYRKAAKKIVDRLATYPRTSDGGFWHADTASRAHQLWADGVYMVNPFLVEYGEEFGDSSYTDDEAAKQLAVYGSHLQVANGLLEHAYDESKSAGWADPRTGLAPEHWCRAVGWYSMAIVGVLDGIPQHHPRRAQLLGVFRKLAAGLEKYQDPATGRWFQVIDKGARGATGPRRPAPACSPTPSRAAPGRDTWTSISRPSHTAATRACSPSSRSAPTGARTSPTSPSVPTSATTRTTSLATGPPTTSTAWAPS